MVLLLGKCTVGTTWELFKSILNLQIRFVNLVFTTLPTQLQYLECLFLTILALKDIGVEICNSKNSASLQLKCFFNLFGQKWYQHGLQGISRSRADVMPRASVPNPGDIRAFWQSEILFALLLKITHLYSN